MADDRLPADDQNRAPGGAGSGPPADATAPMPAASGATAAMPATGGATAAMPATGGATAAMPATGGATAAMPATGGATAAMPIPGTGAGAETPKWAARAAVPPAGAVPQSPGPVQWQDGNHDPYARRSWLAPVGIGLLVLMLLAALAVGLYLIFETRDKGVPATGPSVSSTPSSVSPSLTWSSAPPPTAPASTAAAQVTVPPLVGVSEADAKRLLADAGLKSEVTYRVDDSMPAGTVLASTPSPASTVGQGAVVKIVVARARPATNAPPSASASAGSRPS